MVPSIRFATSPFSLHQPRNNTCSNLGRRPLNWLFFPTSCSSLPDCSPGIGIEAGEPSSPRTDIILCSFALPPGRTAKWAEAGGAGRKERCPRGPEQRKEGTKRRGILSSGHQPHCHCPRRSSYGQNVTAIKQLGVTRVDGHLSGFNTAGTCVENERHSVQVNKAAVAE